MLQCPEYMMRIPHNKPCIGEEEIRAASRVLRSSWLVMGKEVERLEKSMREITGRRYAVAANSGLSALHLSLLSLGVGKGDEVIIPTYTCTALLHAVNYIQATPVLVDTEENGYTLDAQKAKRLMTRRTKAIIVPHTFGVPADMDAISAIGIPVIEDCAQAFGSTLKGRHVGRSGTISVFSFYASKMIAAGQGGMAVTDSTRVYTYLRDLIRHDQRKTYKIRYNYQCTDLTASVANAQLSKLDRFLSRRKTLAGRYRDICARYKEVQCTNSPPGRGTNYYRFVIHCPTNRKRTAVREALSKQGISSIIPIESYQLLHRQLKLGVQGFPNAEQLARTTLSIPIFPCLSEAEVDSVCSALSDGLHTCG